MEKDSLRHTGRYISNRLSLKVVLRTERVNAKGLAPLAVVCHINGQREVIHIGVSIEPKYFNKLTGEVSLKCPESHFINQAIAGIKNRIWNVRLNADEAHELLTGKKLKYKLKYSSNSENNFIEFCEKELRMRKVELKPSTYKSHKSCIKKLKDFKEDLPFSELNSHLITEYQRYLKTKKKNNINTIWAAVKTIKTYYNFAKKQGIKMPNPFEGVKVQKGARRITFLDADQVKVLRKAYFSNKVKQTQKESLLCFLVSCFTSLRISDVYAFEKSWIRRDHIVYKPLKTRDLNKELRIKITKVAAEVIDDLLALKKQKKLKAEQKINKDLKELAKQFGIKENLTMHVGRHTFATIYLWQGGSLHALKELMGHSKIETTMIYSHVIDKSKDEQMDRFDKTFNMD